MSTLAELEQTLDILRKERDTINEEIALIHKDMKKLIPSQKNMKTTLFPIVRDKNWAIGPNVSEEDITNLFSGEPVAQLMTADIFDILVKSGAFESKGQARKNWTGVKEIPTGWTEIGPIGKQKLFLFIWNPTI